MKLTVRHCEGDWYVIERAEHDGRTWLDPVGDRHPVVRHMVVRCSSRFSDADVEGSAAEMRVIADAIRLRTFVQFKRCAVDARSAATVAFWSPRNSTQDGTCTLAEADELALAILATLPPEVIVAS